jgi:tetratricopeptide (TPR) repeat protein
MSKPRVFVVMAFGVKEVEKEVRIETGSAVEPTGGTAESSVLKVNFDEVYQRILKPAIELAGCETFRADEEAGAGDIRTDMFFELVTAEIVLADISILNANVFYELGIRHGLSPRGVLMVHAGWSHRPFDIAPDRTFSYDGKLFEPSHVRDQAWEHRLELAIRKLAGQLRGALDADKQTIGSPLYKEVSGLKPVDWSDIQTARAKYFGGILDDWRQRVQVARRNGYPGDILTLAGDAPTRLHREKLLYAAAQALIALQRYTAARTILRELLEINETHFDARCQLGLVFNRIGKRNEAIELLEQLTDERPGDPEAHGILGRVYKDLWKSRWEKEGDPATRQCSAIAYSASAAKAIQSYATAHRADLDSYYNGINIVTLCKLLEHLQSVTGQKAAATGIDNLNELIAVVRVGACNALERARRTTTSQGRAEVPWISATLGELELAAGNADSALQCYQTVSSDPSIVSFQIESMLSQVCLLDRLGFRPDAVQPVVELLQSRLNDASDRKIEFKRVFICSGHMIDEPDRPFPRFPGSKEVVVREAIKRQLEEWKVGPGDLAICGGARGADILFAEGCRQRGAYVKLFIALPEEEFLARSVRLPDSNWVKRFYELIDHSETAFQDERLGEPPEGISPFARNNLWIINTARTEAPRGELYALLVWDKKESGDGLGGTAHFAEQADKLGGDVKIIDPTAL